MNRNAWKKRYKRGYPSVKDCQLVKKITTEIKEELLPHLTKFFKNFEIHFTKHGRYIGMYIHGSYEKPIILLAMDRINATCKEFDCDKYCAIETTIVHELGHAIVDSTNEYVDEEEDEVEEFAREWYWSRQLYEFWDGFEPPGKQSRKVVASNGGT
jgi:hypothetical protein